MPRRMITSEIFFNEKVGSLPAGGRLLFIGIFSNADDDGRLKASPKFLKARIFPYDDDISSEDVLSWRDLCHDIGLIRIYNRDGKEYLDIPGWLEHQSIRKDRYKESTIPACDNQTAPTEQPADNQTAPTEQPVESQQETTGLRSIGEGRLGEDNPSNPTKVPNGTLVSQKATYEEVMEKLKTTKNPQGTLFELVKGKWPNYEWNHKPARSHISFLGEMVKGFGLERVVHSVWIAEAERPIGNPLAYVKAVLLNKGKPPNRVEATRGAEDFQGEW